MERFEIIKDIGSGNFGVAKLVSDKQTRELFAVKFIERGQKVQAWPCLFFFFFFLFFYKKFDLSPDMITIFFHLGF